MKYSFKSFARFLGRNKLYTFIEFFGLCISLAFIILIVNYSVQESTVPQGQKDADKIYALGSADYMGMTYGTAEVVCPKVPEIEEYCRVEVKDRDVVVGEGYFKTQAMAVDGNFLEFFSTGLACGDAATALDSREGVLVSESFANKAFGGAENALGKSVGIIADDTTINATVYGVLKDFKNHIFKPTDIVPSIRHPYFYSAQAVGDPLDHFGNVDTFVKLAAGSDVKEVTGKVDAQYKANIQYYGSAICRGASLTRMDKIYFTDFMTNYRHGNKNMLVILLIAALVLLVSAILNYLNLSVAQSGKRAREMATRRILGSQRSSILADCCLDSLLFCTVCFIAAYLLASACKNAADSLLGTSLNLLPGLTLTSIYIALILVIALVSGVSQFLFISRMKPVDVLKGDFALRSKNVFSKVFIVIQSGICIVLLSLAFTMQCQMNYLVKRPRGYNIDNLYYVQAQSFHDRSRYEILRREVTRLPSVKNAGLCNGTPGGYTGGQIIKIGSMNLVIRLIRLDTASFNMLGFKVISNLGESIPYSAFYTEDAVRLAGGVDSIRVQEDARLPICGVIDDFVYGNATYAGYGEIPETNGVQIMPDDFPWFYGILVETAGNRPEAAAEINRMWETEKSALTVNPSPLVVQSMKDIVFGDLKGPRNTMKLIITFMILSIIISLLGLYAICNYYTSQNSKNIAVNKVFGASTAQVAGRHLKSFLWPLLVSVVIAVPASVYVIRRYLETFPDRTDAPYWVIAAAVVISLVFSLTVLLAQIFAAASANPTDHLKENN